MVMTRLLAIIAVLVVAAGLATPARTDAAADCFSEDIERRIDGCTALIEQRGQSVADLSFAYAMRALAYSLKGRYDTAIRDYDAAIAMKPDFAVANSLDVMQLVFFCLLAMLASQVVSGFVKDHNVERRRHPARFEILAATRAKVAALFNHLRL